MKNIKINTRLIKAKRVELDLNQVYMAKELDCTPTTYSKKERGKVDFNGKELIVVSKVLKLPLEKLYIFDN